MSQKNKIKLNVTSYVECRIENKIITKLEFRRRNLLTTKQ